MNDQHPEDLSGLSSHDLHAMLNDLGLDPDLRARLEWLAEITLAHEWNAAEGKPDAQTPALNTRLPYRR